MGEVPAKPVVKATEKTPLAKKDTVRNLVAYWILGLCNNYGYVVMLTAANDILSEQEESDLLPEGNAARDCNFLSTGAILLADIIPALVAKSIAPFLPFFVNVQLFVSIICASLGFLVVAFSTSTFMSISGVVLTAFSSGLGEVTLLRYSSFYDKNVVSTWSSGTGGAGIIGALSYTLLEKLGTRNALLIMLVVPFAMGVSFWVILCTPDASHVQSTVNVHEISEPKAALFKKFKLIPGLMRYMIPLGLVYLFEYFINQGTFELVYFENIFIDHAAQYRWLQVDYQLGVFISRSSVNIIHVKHIWLMAVLQLFNVAFFTTEAILYYMPSFWIVLALTLWEGLLGGAAYVNTFYKISSEVPEEDKQFSMATTSFADTIGITLAGILAIVAHNKICALPKPDRG